MKTEMKVKVLSNTGEFEQNIVRGAKLCYSSAGIEELQEKVTPEEAEKFLEKILGLGHGSVLEHSSITFAIEGISRACYDNETEVYTNNGWKLFRNVKEDDLIMTRNEKGQVEFHKPNEYIEYDYNGDLHYYKSQSVDLAVTPNHKMFVKKYDVRVPQDYSLVASEDLDCNRYYMTKLVEYTKPVENTVIIPSVTYRRKNNVGGFYEKTLPELVFTKDIFVKFLAWYLSEGSTYYDEKENKYVISICQTKYSDKNKQNIEDIMTIVTDMGFSPYYDGHNVKFNSYQLGKWLKVLGVSHEKKMPFEPFDFFNKEYAQMFIEEYSRADASIDKRHVKLYTTSKELANQLQMIVFISGMTAKIWEDDRVGESHTLETTGQEIKNNRICYVVSISHTSRNATPVVKLDKHLEFKPYSGKVFCVNVENHVIFVRRNGIATWCGNCTHQLVRHRIASYSQKSQRYVKEAQFEYVVPKDIENNDFASNLYIDLMEQIQLTYDMIAQELLVDYINDYINEVKHHPFLQEPIEDILNVRDFLARFKAVDKATYAKLEKRAIENARYVLPNACETKIQVTMNVRALFNFFKERLCDRAQEEIRELAWLMWLACMEISPTIFKHAVPTCVNGKCKEGAYSCGKMLYYKEKHGAIINQYTGAKNA